MKVEAPQVPSGMGAGGGVHLPLEEGFFYIKIASSGAFWSSCADN